MNETRVCQRVNSKHLVVWETGVHLEWNSHIAIRLMFLRVSHLERHSCDRSVSVLGCCGHVSRLERNLCDCSVSVLGCRGRVS